MSLAWRPGILPGFRCSATSVTSGRWDRVVEAFTLKCFSFKEFLFGFRKNGGGSFLATGGVRLYRSPGRLHVSVRTLFTRRDGPVRA
jgi:hypothetical protein